MVRHDLRVNSRFDARVIKHKDQDGSAFLERNTDTGKVACWQQWILVDVLANTLAKRRDPRQTLFIIDT